MVKEEKKSFNKKEVFRAVKYLLFACSAGAVQVISFTILNEFVRWSYWPSYLIALILSVIWNFTFNRKFTFRTVSNIALAMLEITAYYVVFTPLSTWWGEALVGIGWNEYLVLLFTMVINLITEYLVYLFVIYRHKVDNALVCKKEIEEKTETISGSGILEKVIEEKTEDEKLIEEDTSSPNKQ